MKWCIYDMSRRCFHESCSSLDSMGNVVVCRLVRTGFFVRKVSGGSPASIFSLMKGKGRHSGGGS